MRDCDCVPGHQCDCWDYRAEAAQQRGGLDVERLSTAFRSVMQGRSRYQFDTEKRDRWFVEHIAAEYARLSSQSPVGAERTPTATSGE